MPVTASDRTLFAPTNNISAAKRSRRVTAPTKNVCAVQMCPIIFLVLCKKCLSFFGTVIMLQMLFINSVKL